MTGRIVINGNIGNFDDDEAFTDLVGVISQVRKQPEATSFNVYINSVGGYVSTGKDIYNYLKSLGLPITTIGTGLVASIATVIFMAGSRRMVQEGCKFMIHLPMGGVMGTADEISNYAKEMKKVQEEMVNFYCKELNLSKEAIEPLLTEESWLTEQQLGELGITTDEVLKAVAKAGLKEKIVNKPKPNKMANNKKETSLIRRILNMLDDTATAKVLFDAENNEIVFPALEEDAVISEGDDALINDQPAEGEVLLADGRTVVFVAGKVTEIREANDDDAGDDELAAMTAERDALIVERDAMKAELDTVKADLAAKMKVINKIKALESEFKSEPVNRKRNSTDNKKVSRFKAAMENLKN